MFVTSKYEISKSCINHTEHMSENVNAFPPLYLLAFFNRKE